MAGRRRGGIFNRRRGAPGEPTRCSMDRSTSEALRPAPGPLSHREIRAIIGGIIVAMLLAALDQTIVATALPTIGRELGDVEDMPWVVTAYLLASTAVTPLYGKFSDSHGRRITLLIGIVTFIVGSLACALAPTMFLLIAARLAQGLGGGGLISLAQTIIADIGGAEGARPLPGLHRERLRVGEPAWAGARRLLRRASALVGDLLDQPAARRPGVLDEQRGAEAPAALRPPPPARRARRRAPHGCDDRPSPRAQLGRPIGR